MENNSQIPVQLPQKNHQFLYILVFVQLLVIIGLVSLVTYVYWQDISTVKLGDDKTENAIVTSEEKAQKVGSQVGYLKDGDVWVLTADGKEQQVTDTRDSTSAFAFPAGNVRAFAMSDDKSKLVYVLAKKKKLEGGYEDHQPIKVIFQDFTTNQVQELITLNQITIPNSEYELKIRDANISPDGSKVVYSTSDSIYIYDTVTEQNRQIFSAAIEDFQGKTIVYGYYDLHLSPDYQKILVTKGFYEGSAKAVVDVETGKLYDLPVEAHGYGRHAQLLWLNNTELGVFEMEDTFPLLTTRFYTLNWTGKTKKNSRDMEGYYPDHAELSKDGKFVYGFSGKSVIRETFDDGSQLIDTHSRIIKIELATGTVTELASKIKKKDETYMGLRLSPDESTLFIEETDYGPGARGSVIYTLDLTTPNAELMEVVSKGTFKIIN